VPVLLAPQLSAAARDALWPRLDGLVLTGGGDIEPSRFGQPTHPRTTLVSASRDGLELELVDRALRDDVPMFAICRGLQVLNVALGGTLHQHVPDVYRDKDSELRVNSFHHQAIARLGRDLREVAWAPDRVIEAVEHTDRERFVVAVQWHPEDLVGHDAAARALFEAIVTAARGRATR
jgi:putative glutamine amidotransferase